MKLLLIKIGKAWHTIRRDGLLHGGRRVLSSFISLFKRVRPGDVLFITGGVGDSARFRTAHVGEELARHGFKTSVTVQDNPFLATYADTFSVFVFHRVLYTPRVAQLIKNIEAQKKEIIFETDDLVYDAAFLTHMDYFTQMNAFERKLYENGVGGEILALPSVKVCTTSTTFLAEKLREKGKLVFVIRNTVSKEDVKQAEAILQDVKKDESVVRVAYLSGTPSHNKDFATITTALAALFEKYPEMRLVLVGPLDTDQALGKWSDRIERIPFLPRAEYFSTVSQMDINLAPLEIGNPFCEAKSELKWLEAGLLRVPTVAAATGTFTEMVRDGIDGYVAGSTEEWREKIGKLIEEKAAREQMGARARERVLEHCTTSTADNKEYYEYLLNCKRKNV